MKKHRTGFLSKATALLLAATLIWLGALNQVKPVNNETLSQQSTISLLNFPALNEQNTDSNESLLDKILSALSKLIFGADLREPEALLQYDLPGNEEEAQDDILFEFDDSELPQDIVLELEKIQRETETEPTPTADPQVTGDTDTPSVLIYHTHTDEAYLKGTADVYKETSTGRTMNPDYSVVKVGSVLADGLKKSGLTVYQDKTDHISGGFLKAYAASLTTMNKYTDKCSVFIDVHRDAYIEGMKNSITVNGQSAALIMFVVGTGEGSTGKGYNPKPNWKANYKLALAVTNKLNALYPGICRSVYVRVERFNQHVSDSCMLAEIGNQENTLEEAELSAKLLAEAVSAVLKGQ